MSGREHDRFADDVGAYLLGALEPLEERRFEKHVEGCAQCRQEVARLEVARDALPASVEQHSPGPEMKAALMEIVRAEAAERAASSAAAARPSRPARSGSRWRDVLLARPRLAGAVAACMVAIGVAAGALVGTTGGGGAAGSSTVAATVDASRMPAAKGSLVVPADADAHGGAILRVEGMQAPQSGHVYEVWIKRGRTITPSSLFTVGSDGTGAAAIPHRLRGADAVLVTREPEGGSKKPSERSLVTVPLSS